MSRKGRSVHGSRLTSSGGNDGPKGAHSRSHPLIFQANRLQWMIPSAFEEHKAHYDQRTLQCIKCGNVPKQKSLLDDTPDGYVCRAVGACAKRAKEND